MQSTVLLGVTDTSILRPCDSGQAAAMVKRRFLAANEYLATEIKLSNSCAYGRMANVSI
jgi:hypothetical protein